MAGITAFGAKQSNLIAFRSDRVAPTDPMGVWLATRAFAE
jgi:hypothetical protein